MVQNSHAGRNRSSRASDSVVPVHNEPSTKLKQRPAHLLCSNGERARIIASGNLARLIDSKGLFGCPGCCPVRHHRRIPIGCETRRQGTGEAGAAIRLATVASMDSIICIIFSFKFILRVAPNNLRNRINSSVVVRHSRDARILFCRAKKRTSQAGL